MSDHRHNFGLVKDIIEKKIYQKKRWKTSIENLPERTRGD